MNKDKSDELVAFLLESLKSSKDFLAEQIPEVAKEMLAWGTAYYSVGVTCFALAALLFLLLARFCCKRLAKEEDKDKREITIGVFLVSCVAILLFMLLTIYPTCQLLKIRFAPRLYLMEEITAMVKKGNS